MSYEFNPYPSEDTESMPLRVTRDPMDTPPDFKYTLGTDLLALLGGVTLALVIWAMVAALFGVDVWELGRLAGEVYRGK